MLMESMALARLKETDMLHIKSFFGRRICLTVTVVCLGCCLTSLSVGYGQTVEPGTVIAVIEKAYGLFK